MDSFEDLKLLSKCVKGALKNSKNYKISVLMKMKKACDKNNLDSFSKKLELKIERAEKLREINKKRLEELRNRGLRKNSPIRCKGCFYARNSCKTTVFDFKEDYIQVNCREADLIGDDFPLIEALKIELIPN